MRVRVYPCLGYGVAGVIIKAPDTSDAQGVNSYVAETISAIKLESLDPHMYGTLCHAGNLCGLCSGVAKQHGAPARILV